MGFIARYFWEVEGDLDAREYWARYLYFGRENNLLYMETQFLRSDEDETTWNLDGGIGTVLVQWHYLPLPLEGVGEVRILVRQKPKGKKPPPPLMTVNGRPWLTLGLRSDSGTGTPLDKGPQGEAAVPTASP